MHTLPLGPWRVVKAFSLQTMSLKSLTSIPRQCGDGLATASSARSRFPRVGSGFGLRMSQKSSTATPHRRAPHEHAAAAGPVPASRRPAAATAAGHAQSAADSGTDASPEQALMAIRRGRKVRVSPAGRKWIRINPDQERVRRAFRVDGRIIAMPPRIQRLVRGFMYRS